MPEGLLEGRVALVTGASRGIGAAVAKLFAAQGAHIIALARTVGGLEELDDAIAAAGGTATLVPQDLADLDAIDRLGAALHERFGKLDILVANAGVLGVLSPIAHVEPKVWDETMLLNVTVNFRLIRSLDPLLRLSDAGRAIFVTSGAARAPRAYWGPYGTSKAALDYMVGTWAQEVLKTNIRVNLINPGATRTAMRATAMPGEDPMTLPAPEDIAPAFLDLASPACTKHGEIVNAQ
ncbi:MAG: SDR family NAD(P)-dependent oxidoreductase [Alphaproteobacteria bacterium]|nr:SDR family NAD(P)-dependent oxidoreductase [Alphaproteobacteria bacterium]